MPHRRKKFLEEDRLKRTKNPLKCKRVQRAMREAAKKNPVPDDAPQAVKLKCGVCTYVQGARAAPTFHACCAGSTGIASRSGRKQWRRRSAPS